jgi:hypothetical protein
MATPGTVNPRRCISILRQKIFGNDSMLDRTLLPPQLTITEEDLQNTPPVVLLLLEYLLRENGELKK